VSSARPYPFGGHRFCCGFSVPTFAGDLYASVSKAYPSNAARPTQKQFSQLYVLEPGESFPEHNTFLSREFGLPDWPLGSG